VLFGFGSGPNAMIDLRDCAGPVTFDGVFGDFLGGFTAAEIVDCASVTFANTTLQVSGLTPQSPEPMEAAGIDALRSSVFLHESIVFAGSGHGLITQGMTEFPPSDGAPAIRLLGSTLTVTGSQIAAGSGGGVAFGDCAVPGDGGVGVHVDSAGTTSSTVRIQDSFINGGFGGGSAPGCGFGQGLAGDDFDVVQGTLQFIPGLSRSFGMASPVTEGQALPTGFNGSPGDQVLLLVSSAPAVGQFLPSFDVTLHISTFIVVDIGVLPSGGAGLVLTAPQVPASVDFLHFQIQAAFLGTSGDVYVTGPTTVVVVEDGL